MGDESNANPTAFYQASCRYCGTRAEFHVTVVEQGTAETIHLCMRHASEAGPYAHAMPSDQATCQYCAARADFHITVTERGSAETIHVCVEHASKNWPHTQGVLLPTRCPNCNEIMASCSEGFRLYFVCRGCGCETDYGPLPAAQLPAAAQTNLEEYATYYLDRLDEDEDAWFALVEAPQAIMPFLISAFCSESDAAKRSTILNVIWQHRVPSTIPLFGEALQDSSPLVWKEALDGLVALGGPQCIATVDAAYGRTFDQAAEQIYYREFLDEAREQLLHRFDQ
jgi:hypothetical protein